MIRSARSAPIPFDPPPFYAPGAGAAWRSRLAYIGLRALGWRLRYQGLSQLAGPRGVLIVYPHTSNWDFIVGILAKWIVHEPIRFVGKESLFRGPFAWWFRWIGGRPVNRKAASGAVLELSSLIQSEPQFWLALSPEGTRSKLPHWRTGFYHVALAADVPVALAYLDYPRKEIGVAGFLRLSGEPNVDLPHIAAALSGHRGKFPANESSISFAPTETP